MITITEGVRKLTIDIEGYQFPEAKTEAESYDYDANWLNVAVSYTDGSALRRAVDPCLLATEIDEVIDAFERVRAKGGAYISDFLEPYLQMAFLRDGERVGVVAKFVYDTSDVWKDWTVTQFLDPEEAEVFARAWQEMKVRFPSR